MSQRSAKLLAIILVLVTAVSLGVACVLRSQTFMEGAAEHAGSMATELLGSRINLGNVKLESLSTLSVSDVNVYDKEGGLIAHADKTDVDFSLLSMLNEAAAVDGVKCITLTGVEGNIIQRADGSFNFQDLISDEPSSSNYKGRIMLKDGSLRVVYDSKEIQVDSINGKADMANYPAVAFDADAVVKGAPVKVSGNVGGSDQTLNVETENVQIGDYLNWIPANTIPDSVKDIGGTVKRLEASVNIIGSDVYYTGELQLANGEATILDNKVENINGLVVVDENKAMVFANATSHGQKAAAHGKVFLNTGTPVLDLVVDSESFDQSFFYKDINYSGPIKFVAHITGAANEPSVDAEFSIKQGSAAGYEFGNTSGKVHYSDSRVYVKDLKSELLGGSVSGEAEFNAKDYSYVAHVIVNNIQAGNFSEYVPDLTGSVSGDLAVSGKGSDTDSIKVYGTVNAASINYNGLNVTSAECSFSKVGNEVAVDYLNVKLPYGGKASIDGNLVLNSSLDFNFTASNIDLSILSQYLSQNVVDVPMSGFADANGTIKGAIDNPIVRAEFAARQGSIYYQPFDGLHGNAAGSLQGVKIYDCHMDYGEKTQWLVHGQVGFLGDMGIDLTVETVAARAEDLVKAIDPDLPLTGNVDNIITIKGSLKEPDVTGYIHFYTGSYKGVLLQGMDGDYYVKNHVVKLQDFHVYSPWVDMDANGTIDMNKDNLLNLHVEAHEVELNKLSEGLPYPISGKAKFSGDMTGTLDKPYFEGKLTAENLLLNEQSITNAQGLITYEDDRLFVKNFGFEQEGAKFDLNGHINVVTQEINADLQLDRVELNGMLALFNAKNDSIFGRVNGKVIATGTIDNPSLDVNAYMAMGTAGDYAIKNVVLSGTYANRVINLQTFTGDEGDNGKFAAQGTVNLDGNIDARASVDNIDIGMLAAVAGKGNDYNGKLKADVQASGTVDAPVADISLEANNIGEHGASMIDSVEGFIKINDGNINIDQLVATKTVNKIPYNVTATGVIPLDSLKDDSDGSQQMNVLFSLDDAQLTVMPGMDDYIDWALGDVDGKLRLTGTKNNPLINGSFILKDGALKPVSETIPITDMYMQVDFTGNTASITSCTGKMGDGSYNVTGHFAWDGHNIQDYNLDIATHKLDVDCDFYSGPLNMIMKLERAKVDGPADMPPKYVPKISGQLDLDDVVLSVPTIPSSNSEMPDIMLDYQVNLGKHVQFHSASLGDLSLAGYATFKGTTRLPQTGGQIYVKHGTVSYLKIRFNVTEGTLTFGLPLTLLPTVNFQANTKISNTKVFLDISGPADNMTMKLRSIPYMSEADIIQLLTFRTDLSNNNNSSNGMLTSIVNLGLQMTLLGEVEDAMRNVLNLDEFIVEKDTSTSSAKGEGSKDEEIFKIQLGKYINDKFMVRYSKNINNDKYSYGISYDFNDRTSVEVKKDKDLGTYIGINGKFTFSTAPELTEEELRQ